MKIRTTLAAAIAAAVLLSGFAKNSEEKYAAQRIAQGVSGVKMVKNEIAVRP